MHVCEAARCSPTSPSDLQVMLAVRVASMCIFPHTVSATYLVFNASAEGMYVSIISTQQARGKVLARRLPSAQNTPECLSSLLSHCCRHTQRLIDSCAATSLLDAIESAVLHVMYIACPAFSSAGELKKVCCVFTSSSAGHPVDQHDLRYARCFHDG